MKRIEEVVKALDTCISNVRCVDICPYFKDGCIDYEMEKDALHYLKEYQTIADACHKHGIGSIWGTMLPDPEKVEGKPDIDGCANMPLTWEELKQMDGKPIWISDFGWDIADGVASDSLHTAFGISYKRADMGVEWQAYRKERFERS